MFSNVFFLVSELEDVDFFTSTERGGFKVSLLCVIFSNRLINRTSQQHPFSKTEHFEFSKCLMSVY